MLKLRLSGIMRAGRGMLVCAFFCCLLSGLHGCGYTTRSSLISSKYRTIYIAPFVNKIDIASEINTGNKYKINRPMIDTDVTREVINKYLFDGNLRPSAESSSDLILKGEVVEFRRDPLRYTENDDVREYRLSLVVNLKLIDQKNGDELLWQEDGFTGISDYFVSGPTAKPESAAVTEAIQDLARRIVERTVEVW